MLYSFILTAVIFTTEANAYIFQNEPKEFFRKPRSKSRSKPRTRSKRPKTKRRT